MPWSWEPETVSRLFGSSVGFSGKKKTMSYHDFHAALGCGDITRSKLNWGHYHEIGLIGNVTVTPKDGGLKITGRYTDTEDRVSQTNRDGAGRGGATT